MLSLISYISHVNKTGVESVDITVYHRVDKTDRFVCAYPLDEDLFGDLLIYYSFYKTSQLVSAFRLDFFNFFGLTVDSACDFIIYL